MSCAYHVIAEIVGDDHSNSYNNSVRHDRKNGDREYWKCEDRSCMCRAVTNKGKIVDVI